MAFNRQFVYDDNTQLYFMMVTLCCLPIYTHF